MILTGVPGGTVEVNIDAQKIMRNLVLENQLLYGTVNAGPRAFAHAIADLAKFEAQWPKQVRALITGRFPPENIGDVLAGKDAIKSVITFGEVGRG
jgi:hypothetical protein